MTKARFQRLRLLRFSLWVVAMFVASWITMNYAPKKVVFVPCAFLAIMVPAVLLPMENKPKV